MAVRLHRADGDGEAKARVLRGHRIENKIGRTGDIADKRPRAVAGHDRVGLKGDGVGQGRRRSIHANQAHGELDGRAKRCIRVEREGQDVGKIEQGHIGVFTVADHAGQRHGIRRATQHGHHAGGVRTAEVDREDLRICDEASLRCEVDRGQWEQASAVVGAAGAVGAGSKVDGCIGRQTGDADHD